MLALVDPAQPCLLELTPEQLESAARGGSDLIL